MNFMTPSLFGKEYARLMMVGMDHNAPDYLDKWGDFERDGYNYFYTKQWTLDDLKMNINDFSDTFIAPIASGSDVRRN
jgi:hypothetical protein